MNPSEVVASRPSWARRVLPFTASWPTRLPTPFRSLKSFDRSLRPCNSLTIKSWSWSSRPFAATGVGPRSPGKSSAGQVVLPRSAEAMLSRIAAPSTMTPEVALDANVLVGLFDPGDSLHENAIALIDEIGETGVAIVSLDFIVEEALSVLCRRSQQRKGHPPNLLSAIANYDARRFRARAAQSRTVKSRRRLGKPNVLA
jgi:hypothetical protein